MNGRDLPSGHHPVCPRCGGAAGDAVFCAGCGLNLRQQGELPTADAYAAGEREKAWFAKQERDREEKAHEAGRLREAERETERRLAERREAEQRAGADRAAAQPAHDDKGRRRAVLGAIIAVLVIAGAVGVTLALSSGDDTGGKKQPAAAREGTSNTSREGEPTSTEPERNRTNRSANIYFTDDNGKARIKPRKLFFGKTRISDIVWTEWTNRTASGTGLYEAPDCDPDCATGGTITADAKVTLRSPLRCAGKLQYTKGSFRMTDSSTGERYSNDDVVSSELDCVHARSADGETESDPGACDGIKFTKGSISCGRALDIAHAAIESGEGAPNDAVNIRGYDCYVYPYAVDCSSSTIAFDTTFGTNGEQTG